MLALGDVKRWNAGTLDQVFQTVQQRQQILVSSGDDFRGVVPIDGWEGTAADAMADAHNSLFSALDYLAAGTSIVNKTVAQAADAIPAVQGDIQDAEELAAKYGYQIEDDGSITDTLTNPGPNDPSPDERALAKQQVSDTITEALRTAGDIDNDLAAVLRRASSGGFGTGTETTVQGSMADGLQESPGEVLTTPPPNGTPSQNAAWWNSLSTAGQNILLHDHPDWLGNLDGIPGSVRSKANMSQLQGLIDQAQAKVDHIQAQVNKEDPYAWNPLADAQGFQLNQQLQAAEADLNSLNQIKKTMGLPDRQLLLLDTSQPRVEAAIAVGDVDTATNVAVFTPGFTTTVDGDLAKYDSDMDHLRNMSTKISGARNGSGTATVTWIGYQAPQGAGIFDPSTSVASPETAESAGNSLAQFYDGIGAVHDLNQTPLHLTALGHSYGSTTTGFALGHNTPVNDAILFGSPGQGPQHLNVPAGHLYDEHDQGDNLVPSLHGTLGPSPYYGSPDVVNSYHQLSTDASTSSPLGNLNATSGHSGYLDNNSTSLFNMAAVVSGNPGLVINGPLPLAGGSH